MEPSRANVELQDSSQSSSEDAIRTVRDYWDGYASRLTVPGAVWGSKQFFAEIKPAHDAAYAPANQVLNWACLKDRTVLELGCGIGLDTVEFARRGARVTALDLSPTCLRLAQRLLTYHGLEATFTVGDAEHLPYPANSFDIVVARGLLMYTPNDRKVTSEIIRVLKPRGEANILLHNRFSWYVILARLSRTNLFREEEDPPINRLYSIRQAKTMLTKFSSYKLFFDRFPSSTKTRTGTIARLYNTAFVPLMQMLPTAALRRVGFYIIAQATK